MKKLNLLFAIVAMLFFLRPEQSAAQVSSIVISGVDSTSSFCSLPSWTGFSIYGEAVGTVTGTPDSLVTVNVNFGDGSDTTFVVRAIPRTGGGEIYPYVTHNYKMPGSFTWRIIASVPSGARDTFTGPTRTYSNSCGTLNGNLYIDANSNCIKETSEHPIYWTNIMVINTSTLDTFNAGWADDTGHYSLSLPPGAYNIIPNALYIYPGIRVLTTDITPSCPSTGVYSLTVAASTAYTKDFAYACTPVTAYDAKIIVGSKGFIPGDSTTVQFATSSYWGYYHNVCAGLSTKVTVVLDPMLTYLRPAKGLTPTVSGSTLTYTLSTTADVDRFYSSVWVMVPTTATIGDTVRISATIDTALGLIDTNKGNNVYNFKRAVTSSYDPNMKEVAPTGYGTDGFVAKNTPLTYTIHFQNTGTAPAKNITITDEIDADLQIATVHLIGATHNTNLYRDGNTIKFRFENINLPDSGANYEASMGSVTYSILPVKNLAPATKMENTAKIYFDYNAPIITNTTLNTIIIPTNIQQISLGILSAKVYPNPANTALNIKVENNNEFSVTMIDMLGRVVSVQNTNNGTVVVATETMPAGLYIVTIKDNKGNEASAKVVVKH